MQVCRNMSATPFSMRTLFTFLATSLEVVFCVAALCGRGEYFVESNNSCVRCPENSYMNRERHSIRSCFRCSDLQDVPHVKELNKCTPEEDTSIARCDPGFYPGKNYLSEFECHRCPLSDCEKGEQGCCENEGTTPSVTEETPGQERTNYSKENAEIFTLQPENVSGSEVAKCKRDKCNIEDTTIGGKELNSPDGNGNSSDGKEDNVTTIIILAVTLSIVAALIIALLLVCCLKKRCRKYRPVNKTDNNANLENGMELQERHP